MGDWETWFSAAGIGRLARIEGKMNVAKYRDPWWKPAQDLRLGQRFTFQQDNDPKHTAKTTQEWLRKQVSECPWVAQAEPGLQPNRTSLDSPENSCAATLPIQPHRAWEDLQRRMGETPQIQVCQACVASYPRRPEAVIAAKGASTKYWVKGLNPYVNVIFLYIIFHN